ncbi:glycoside hydrolase superfamily [Penicillium macrosclerotiorum]|uniref:glycoside hydrolase superfamily n=1 Tax=Penicillium macrosclerotiorum TaxID=303699 RepID=UPI00254753DA|nr:glycoside hydrolase superfamily [Penicillium macrosclerotiorum]KAJ5673898.1 glycoside hydrolase superfamily [Penicillium macrosclerotiorum]
MFDADEIVPTGESGDTTAIPPMEELPLPADMTWGCATSAYQIEGGAFEDGKGESVWDRVSHLKPSRTNGEHGDVACDHYHRMAADVALLSDYGVEEYRFSIAWTRIVPLGGREDPTNEAGFAFYDSLIDSLRARGIEPVVTLFHWDTPQALSDRYGAVGNLREFQADFVHYAKLCFARFGDRVRRWVTFNEPYIMAVYSSETQSDTDTWVIAHNTILTHAATVQAYVEHFQATQGGSISIVLNANFFEPYDISNSSDQEAASRRLLFYLAWFADPVFLGRDYPPEMRAQLGDRLPRFTPDELLLLRQVAPICSAAFFGLNHYTSSYARARPGSPSPDDHTGHIEEMDVNCEGHQLGPVTGISWLRVTPAQFRKLLAWIWERYHVPILITENGCPCPGESEMTLEQAVEDDFRVQYFATYLDAMSRAIYQDGVQVLGYYAWSFMDNFEWSAGRTPSRSINPGTPVNIILKADQPTGITVSGIVSELLTRGDHPRGVKVRLTDGRVGRVQSIRGGEPTQEELDGKTQDTPDDEPSIQYRTERGDLSGRRNRFTSRDMRLDGPEEPSSEPLGLDMYIRPAKEKKKGKKTHQGQNVELEEKHEDTTDAGTAAQRPGSLKCPVCADFEGDEAAVAHHVAGHFGE